MAYIVTRNSVSGSVSLVEKRRGKNPDGSSSVRDVSIVCGLGVMSKEDFQSYQKWAHGIKDQEMRKEAVLGSMACAVHKTRVAEKTVKGTMKKVTVSQKKTGNKSPVTRRIKGAPVRKSYPVPTLKGYKGRDAEKTHTTVMLERRKARSEEKEMREEILRIKEGRPEKKVIRPMPVSKFSPEGIEFARQSKKALARERIHR